MILSPPTPVLTPVNYILSRQCTVVLAISGQVNVSANRRFENIDVVFIIIERHDINDCTNMAGLFRELLFHQIQETNGNCSSQ